MIESVQDFVACATQCDEVRFRVVTDGASPSHMVNVEIL
jgi:hypothetical protein